MDQRLVAWARAVKARRAKAGFAKAGFAKAGHGGAPVLWLVTDRARLADPRAAVARLPAGLCGVVLRHDDDAERPALARELARLCRARRLALAVAGDFRLAASVGARLHLRGGRRPAGAPRWLRAWTSSAHGVADLCRARRAGAAVALLSPAFATRSHPDARALGPMRWGLAARLGGGAVALGGITGALVRRLPRKTCRGAGAIGALA
jgi:thiamine-phosphate pyrophosphorylase